MTQPTTLPNLSFMMKVGEIRHIQNRYEKGACHNPDDAVAKLLGTKQRLAAWVRGRLLRGRLRANPFYAYVAARTRHYDEVYQAAIAQRVRAIFNIGCGSDTRSYRFGDQLRGAGIRAFEFDQEAAIRAKEALARRHFDTSHVDYHGLDLNLPPWPGFTDLLRQQAPHRVLVMLEGVSPYVESARFVDFLRLLNANTAPGSTLAYDYKLRDAAIGFGVSARTTTPFRLSSDRAEVVALHADLGFEVEYMTTSRALCSAMADSGTQPFDEDVLLRLVRR